MPYTKEALQNLYSLSVEDVNATLSVCGLSTDCNEYADEEIQSGFDTVRQYFTSERVSDYQQATDLFRQELEVKEQPETSPKPKGKKSKNEKNEAAAEPLDISALLSRAKERVGAKISLGESLSILQACGLQDQDEYNQAECDRFLEACDLIKNQHKSFEEVAQYFGLNNSTPDVDTDQLLQQLGDTTALLGEEERELIREMVRQKAKSDMAGLPKLYLQSLLEEMKSPAFQQEWQQLREAFRAKVMGKKADFPSIPAAAAFNELAADIGEWVKIRIDEEKHTIEVKAHKIIEEKAKLRATQIALNKLNESQQWIEAQQKQAKLRSQRSQQFRVNLIHFARWIGSGWSGWLFYLGSSGIYISLGFALGVNFPSVIACPNTKSYCYLLRLDKTTVVIPSDYIKQTSQKKIQSSTLINEAVLRLTNNFSQN